MILFVTTSKESSTLAPTYTGVLPPNSNKHGVRFLDAAFATIRPTCEEPVYKILSNFCSNNTVVSSMAPLTTLKISESKALVKILDRIKAVFGTNSDCFKTIVLPPHSAPTIGCNANSIGTLNGEIIKTVPSGILSIFGEANEIILGTSSTGVGLDHDSKFAIMSKISE